MADLTQEKIDKLVNMGALSPAIAARLAAGFNAAAPALSPGGTLQLGTTTIQAPKDSSVPAEPAPAAPDDPAAVAAYRQALGDAHAAGRFNMEPAQAVVAAAPLGPPAINVAPPVTSLPAVPQAQGTGVAMAASPQPQEKPGEAAKEEQGDYLTQLSRVGEREKAALDAEVGAQQTKAALMYSIGEGAMAKAKTEALEEKGRFQQAVQEADSADRLSQQRVQALATKQIDPDRFWHSKGTGEKIFAVVGAALGAFGATLSHAPNFAMQMIDNAVNRDVEAQRQDIENAKDSNQMLDAISQRKYGRAMTQQQLDAQTRLDGLNFAKQQMDLVSAGADSMVAGAKKEGLKADIDQRILNAKAEIIAAQQKAEQERLLKEEEYAKDIRVENIRASTAGVAASITSEGERQRALAKAIMDYKQSGLTDTDAVHQARIDFGLEKATGQFVPPPPGKEGGLTEKDLTAMTVTVQLPDGTTTHMLAKSPEAASEYTARADAARRFKTDLALMYSLNAKEFGQWSPADHAKYAQAQNDAIDARFTMQHGGRRSPSNEEREDLKKILPDLGFTGMGKEQNAVRLKGLYDQVDMTLEEMNRSFLVGDAPTRADVTKQRAQQLKDQAQQFGATPRD